MHCCRFCTSLLHHIDVYLHLKHFVSLRATHALCLQTAPRYSWTCIVIQSNPAAQPSLLARAAKQERSTRLAPPGAPQHGFLFSMENRRPLVVMDSRLRDLTGWTQSSTCISGSAMPVRSLTRVARRSVSSLGKVLRFFAVSVMKSREVLSHLCETRTSPFISAAFSELSFVVESPIPCRKETRS